MKIRIINIPLWIVKLYLRETLKYKYLTSKSIPGLEDGDTTNQLYTSKRSSIQYLYLRTTITYLLDRLIMVILFCKTGKWFNGSLNRYCSPINYYLNRGDYIKPHRDRNMITGKPVHYIATLILKAADKGGDFGYNNTVLTCSEDGKNVFAYEHNNDIFKLLQGQMIIIDNTDSIHFTTPIIAGKRISLTFRSN